MDKPELEDKPLDEPAGPVDELRPGDKPMEKRAAPESAVRVDCQWLTQREARSSRWGPAAVMVLAILTCSAPER